MIIKYSITEARVLLLLLYLANVVDMASTAWGASIGLYEANPLGLELVIVLKMLLPAIIYYRSVKMKNNKILLGVAVIIYIITIINLGNIYWQYVG